MARVKDPVCGMTIDSDTAAAQSQHDGQTFYFCAVQCKAQFDADPARYSGAARSSDDREVPLERHEPPRTRAGGMIAPKFGSAGSGGAEYERGPETHDREGPSK